MPKIVINEQDLTTTPLRVTNNNVVFIPGFYGADGYILKSQTDTGTAVAKQVFTDQTNIITSSGTYSATITLSETPSQELTSENFVAKKGDETITITEKTVAEQADSSVRFTFKTTESINGVTIYCNYNTANNYVATFTLHQTMSGDEYNLIAKNNKGTALNIGSTSVSYSKTTPVIATCYFTVTSEDTPTTAEFTYNYQYQEDKNMVLCENINTFTSVFGSKPSTVSVDIASSSIITGNSAVGYNSTFNDIDGTNYKQPETFLAKDEVDKSFIIAKELLNNGIPVLYCGFSTGTTGKIVASDIIKLYEALCGKVQSSYTEVVGGVDITDSIFYQLRGLGDYSVKFLTTGCYPVFGFGFIDDDNKTYYPAVDQMVRCSSRRGDCTAIIDGYNNPDGEHTAFHEKVAEYVKNNELNVRTDITTGDPTDKDYYYSHREVPYSADLSGNSAYVAVAYSTATMVYPWLDVNISGLRDAQSVPGSYAYLRALAQSIRQGSDWSAIAGVTRGQIPGFVRLCTNKPLTNTIAETIQPTNSVSIIPITMIRPYGYVIWGNRTLKDNSNVEEGREPDLTATSFLNIRNAVSDVKKTVYDACNSLMFEPNSDVLWINFQSKIMPLLERMRSSEIISGYKIKQGVSKYPYKLLATIVLYPVYDVEEFEITVQLSNEELIIEG